MEVEEVVVSEEVRRQNVVGVACESAQFSAGLLKLLRTLYEFVRVEHLLVLNVRLMQLLQVDLKAWSYAKKFKEVDAWQGILSFVQLAGVVEVFAWVAANDGVLVVADVASVWVWGKEASPLWLFHWLLQDSSTWIILPIDFSEWCFTIPSYLGCNERLSG